MKTIPLTKGLFAQVDDGDFEELNKYRWCAEKAGKTHYAFRRVKSEGGGWSTVRMHRVLLPKTSLVDHVDGNGLNNQRANLRSANRSGNGANRGKNRGSCSSRFKGVSWVARSQKWIASIYVEGHQRHLGYFTDEVEAARAYNKAALAAFGEFAALNPVQ